MQRCCICGVELTDPVIRKIELYQECGGAFLEDNVHELCQEHYEAVSRLFKEEAV